jgi:hypothetical protein
MIQQLYDKNEIEKLYEENKKLKMVKPMIIRQHRIYRIDLQMNQHLLFIFGDNEEREGRGGQAKEMRGEDNAVGIRTKRHPNTGKTAYWTDETYDENVEMIREDFQNLIDRYLNNEAYCGIVIPADGLGTGYAKLQENAPKTMQYLNCCLARLHEIGRNGK